MEGEARPIVARKSGTSSFAAGALGAAPLAAAPDPAGAAAPVTGG